MMAIEYWPSSSPPLRVLWPDMLGKSVKVFFVFNKFARTQVQRFCRFY